MLFQRVAILSCLLFVPFGFAQTPPSAVPHVKLDPNQALRITYEAPSWNTDSTKIDFAYLVMRDKTSGRIVQIQLEETEPDSGLFEGAFSLNVGSAEKIAPEVYVPPNDLRKGTDDDNKKLYGLIREGKLTRKPIIWKRSHTGKPILAVYDDRAQAEAALSEYQQQEKAAVELKRKKPLINMTTDTARMAVKAQEHKAALDKLATDATSRAEERRRLEQQEADASAERERKERAMTEQQRAERKAQARAIGEEANALYDQADYVGAEDKYKKAISLDPDNVEYNYRYGVSLYRNKNYNEALVILKLAKVEPAQQTEKDYYMGLVFYRLNELDSSLAKFKSVSHSSDPTLGPSGLFYEGIILFAQEKYDASKTSFEKVIDTSKDPRLDSQAEEYLDKISSAMAYQKLRENKWTVTAVVGLMYDSNVLLSPTNLPGGGSPTNVSDERLLTLADLQYRPVFNEHHEFTPHATANLTNSSKSSAAPADPFLYDLYLPYSYKTNLFGKNYKFTATPTYELLFMDPTGSGTKGQELSSFLVTVDNTFVMNKDWISTYTVEWRNDNSSDPSSVGPENLSGQKYTFRTVQTLFVDKARKQALLPSIDYIRNPARGSDKTYNRYDLGLTYVRPAFWESIWNLGASYYQMSYPGTSNPNRVDKDYGITTGFSKPIREWVTWGVNGTYTHNASSDPSFAYNKFVILTTATFLTNF